MSLSFYFRTLWSSFYCCVLWIALTNGDKGQHVLLDEPTSGWDKWVSAYGTWLPLLAINGYSVCTKGSSNDQWFVTPFIILPPTITTVLVKTKYTVSSCGALPVASRCSETVVFLKKEQDTASVPLPSLNSNPFTDVIGRETPETAELITGKFVDAGAKSSSSFTVKPQKKGVYFAIKATSVCVAVFTFKVFYRVCSSQGINLVTFPETVPSADDSQNITVNGTCVAHAVRTSSQPSLLYALCDSNGNWTAGVNVSCVCTAGYQQNVSLNTCEACPKGTYKKEDGSEPCSRCPKHSSSETPPTRCRCDSGYYRQRREDDSTNCTSIPSAPLEVKMTFSNSSAVWLEWKEPNDTGGRMDLFYEIRCSIQHVKDRSTLPCGTNVQYYPQRTGLKETSVLVSSLQPYTVYQFQIIAKNGVSDIAREENHTPILLTTKEPTPGIPTGVKVSREKDSSTAHLQWSLEKKNGKILFYEVRYYNVDSGSERKVNSTYRNITITGLDPASDYRFEVRAYTSVGFGKFSKEVVISTVQDVFDSRVLLYAGVAAAVFVLLLIVIIVVLCRRRRSNNIFDKGIDMLQSDGHRLYIDPSTYSDLLTALTTFANELSTNCVKLEKIIGGGEFGEVHKGILTLPKQEPETVAVKLLRSDATMKSRDDFLSEAAVLGQFNHLNVIEMKGVITKSAPMMIILEFMENGSLDNFLKAHDRQLTSLQLIGMARGVAEGMAYLAGMNFIHRDLAARNILVADNMVCKVADFGLTRELEHDNPDSEYMTQGGKIAVRWTALEAIKYRKFSTASDLWSYGILLWEIMTFAERPYWDWTNFQVMDQIEAGYRLPLPTNCPKAVYHIMLECWIVDKTRRPRFTDIVNRLEEFIRTPDLLRNDISERVSRGNTVDFGQIETVQGWLDSIRMGQYKPNFEEAGYVSLKQLVDVNDSDLDKVGVRLAGHRNKMKKNLKGLKDYLHQGTVETSMETTF